MEPASLKITPWDVPERPTGKLWSCHLRWCLIAMREGDRDMAFIASLLSHALKNGGLTPKQAAYAQKAIDRVYNQWLIDLAEDAETPEVEAGDALAFAVPEGRA